MKRKECLDQANEIVHHDRNSEYGEPEDNFGDIASYWTTFLRKKLKTDVQITTPDVAVMSALIKVSRLQNTPGHEDSWRDIAGYAACGAECATEPEIDDVTADYVWHNNRFVPEAEMEGVDGYDRNVLRPKKEPATHTVLMTCGCPLEGDCLVRRGINLYCANCGHHYPWPEKKEG